MDSFTKATANTSNTLRLNLGQATLSFHSVVVCGTEGEPGLQEYLLLFEKGERLPLSGSFDRCTAVQRSEALLGSLRVVREIAFSPEAPDQLRIRLQITNTGEAEAYLKRVELIHTEEKGLQIGGTDSRGWVFFRQGRMKNDLPSVCVLGRRDDAFLDAIGSLSETGGKEQVSAEGAVSLISDQLTVLQAGVGLPQNLLLGYLGRDQFVETRLWLSEESGLHHLCCSCLYDAALPSGASMDTGWLRLESAEDSMEAIQRFARDKADLYHARKRERPLSVFCTWYYYGLSITQADMLSDLHHLKERQIPFDIFQLDEGWEKVLGEWQLNEKFTLSLAQLADTVQAHGFTPGIWTSPFIAHETSAVAKEHPDWLLRHTDGSFCLFPMNGTVYRILDITLPVVIDWVEALYRRLRGYGYRYHKLDFTRAPVIEEDAVFHDKTLSRAYAYRKAIEAVRRGIGEDAYLLICGGLYDPVIGLADAQRVGSDVLSMWSDPFGQGGRAAPYTIKQSILRAWMNTWWDNDPDALMVRRQQKATRGLALTYGLLNEEEVKTSALNQYFSGGIVCSTEPMSSIDEDRLMVLRHLLPPVPVNMTPKDLFAAERYPSVLDVSIPGAGWHTVAVINWSDTEIRRLPLILDRSLTGDWLEPGKQYRVCEFWSGAVFEGLTPGEAIPPLPIAPHGSILLKIEPQSGAPSVIRSSVHFSFGAELKRLEIADDLLYFETAYLFDYPASYTIRLPKGVACQQLPEHCSIFGGDLEIHLPTRGAYRMQIPLSVQ